MNMNLIVQQKHFIRGARIIYNGERRGWGHMNYIMHLVFRGGGGGGGADCAQRTLDFYNFVKRLFRENFFFENLGYIFIIKNDEN